MDVRAEADDDVVQGVGGRSCRRRALSFSSVATRSNFSWTACWSSFMLPDSSNSQTTVSLWSARWRRISRASWSRASPMSLVSRELSPSTPPEPPVRPRSLECWRAAGCDRGPSWPPTLMPGRLPSLIPADEPAPRLAIAGLAEGAPGTGSQTRGAEADGAAVVRVQRGDGLVAGVRRWVGQDVDEFVGLFLGELGVERSSVDDLGDRFLTCGVRPATARTPNRVPCTTAETAQAGAV